MVKIAVFASGRGSNFSAITRAIKKGQLKAKLSLLVCDNPQAPVIAKAKRAGVEVALIKAGDYVNKRDFEAEIIRRLETEKIDLIVLAGFMRILSAEFVAKFKNKIINIHPALLPAFKGAHAIKDAFLYGVKITGVTVHFVDEKMDHGPIILQEALEIGELDTLESLEKRIHRIEHKLYPRAISLYIEGKLKPEKRRVKISNH